MDFIMYILVPESHSPRIGADRRVVLDALVIPAYVLLWRNDIAGRSSTAWERMGVAVIGLPSALWITVLPVLHATLILR